jgi:hypothetical protein
VYAADPFLAAAVCGTAPKRLQAQKKSTSRAVKEIVVDLWRKDRSIGFSRNRILGPDEGSTPADVRWSSLPFDDDDRFF